MQELSSQAKTVAIFQSYVDVPTPFQIDHVMISNYLFSLLFTSDFVEASVQFVGGRINSIAQKSL